MVAALGGPKDFVSRAHALLPRAPVLVDATPETRGFVTSIDVRAVGLAVVELGGGRSRAADAIDPAVGLTELASIGAEVGPAAPLARVHARSADKAEAAVRRLRAAYRIDEAPLSAGDPVIERIVGTLHEPAHRHFRLGPEALATAHGSAAAVPFDRDARRAVRSRFRPLCAELAPSPGRAQGPSQSSRRSSRSAPASIICSPIPLSR